jgi:SAM-dependent methyltransferase
MIIDYKQISQINTNFFRKLYDNEFFEKSHLSSEVGEHYKLLTYLTNLYNDITILDIGTNTGESAIALAQNKNNKVISYDIENKVIVKMTEEYSNIEHKIMDISNETDEIIKSAKIIMFDIAHDGIQEKNFTDRLKRIDYKGFLICDDINCPFYPNMNPWWNSIEIEKYDISDIGHMWGTGLVNYYGDNSIEIIK